MNRVIIDVREPQEYEMHHVTDAINIPPSELLSGSNKLADIEKDTEIVLYCVSGSRSNVSSHILRSQGYTNIVNGINAQQVAAKYHLGIS